MDIYKLLKILSSESKAKIISLYMNCDCHSHTVNDLCGKFHLNQANVSKHLSSLHDAKILDFVREGKEVYYRINADFKKEYKDVIDLLATKNDTFAKCSKQCTCINNK